MKLLNLACREITCCAPTTTYTTIPFIIAVLHSCLAAMSEALIFYRKISNKYPHVVAVMYSEEAEVDSREGMFFFPKHTLKLAVWNTSGEILSKKNLGGEVVPGI